MTTPKTFFLNERQELSSFDREGGGRPASYVSIDWSQRSTNLANSFRRATASTTASRDPLKSRHYFVVAIPVDAVEKHSKSKKAAAQGGITREAPSFGGAQSTLFRKLGMDLIETLPDGRAAVHVSGAAGSQLLSTMQSLSNATDREKSRWINLEEFSVSDWTGRVDAAWLATLKQGTAIDAWIRFQPTLSRIEIQELLQSLANFVSGPQTGLTKAGREFSGRYWCSGTLTKDHIALVARDFTSVQSVHARLMTPFAAAAPLRHRIAQHSVLPPATPVVDVSQLPTVAIVDSGIPEQHVTLARYRRPGYRNPDLDPSVKFMGDHGSNVASCAVFGHIDANNGNPVLPPARCRVMDVMVSYDEKNIDDEIVVGAIEAIVGTAPDVRVFNLSFGGPPLDSLPAVHRREQLIRLQDMDNLAFARDILLVISAGNSPAGVVPEKPYPNHVDDPAWALGVRARSFNGVVCGGYVDSLGDETVAGMRGAPSPFTRIGPGLCDSPVPGFGAPAGNSLPTYQWAPGSGVGVISPAGMWEDHNGTSFAAPVIASEAALAFRDVARHCGPQTVPFAGTVKAWMSLVAFRPSLSPSYERLATRTLGHGFPSARRLNTPNDNSAVFVWQTVLQGPGAVARVQLPVPIDWLSKAKEPKLRIVVSWNGPVNMALADSWACRKVHIKIRPFGAAEALRGGGTTRGGYPLIDRVFDILPALLTGKGFQVGAQLWVLEAEYEQIGEYPPAMTMSPQQRIGAALELRDDGESPLSPQSFVQALPIATELDRLSTLASPILSPITIKQ